MTVPAAILAPSSGLTPKKPDPTQKHEDSKPKETENTKGNSQKTTEETQQKPTHTQESKPKPKTELQEHETTTADKAHLTEAAKPIETDTAHPLVTTFNSDDFATLSTPTPTSKSGVSFATHKADSTAALVSPTSSTLADSSSGMSGGGKAGIAIGIIAGVGLIGALIAFFVLRKRRRQPAGSEELVDNEKSLPPVPPGSVAGRIKQTLGMATPPTHHHELTTEPPRLAEVRPGSQFSPFRGRASMAPFADGITEETPAQTAAASANALFVSRSPTPEHRSRNLTDIAGSTPQLSAQKHQDPFGDPANIIVTPPDDEKEIAPLSEKEPKNEHEEADSNRAVDGNNSQFQSNETNSEASVPPSAPVPSATPSFGSPAIMPMPPSPQNPGPADMPVNRLPPRPNIHRVLLDFDPQMDDELPLRRGRLVRLLHPYDDGWALCSFMDNSAQGVVPRTCLSPLPVKPRFRPGPGNTGPKSPPGTSQGPPRVAPYPEAANDPQGPLRPAPLNTAVPPATHLPTSPISPDSLETRRTSMQVQPPSEGTYSRPASEAVSNVMANKQAESPIRTSPGATYSTVPKTTTPVQLHVFPSIPGTSGANVKPNGSPYRPYSASPPAKLQASDELKSYSPARSDPGVNKAGLSNEENEGGNQLRTDTPDGGQSSRLSSQSFVTADENALASD
ncbi:Src-domain containing protein [Ascosphaera apis ARSEF 7405]|uniref:Src-domain containing protein n=1 Tax=Ascosphaera apis ARSEF 7405 TaxID=392613 RepID=A0A167XGU8_9EURO|nr:Src-domain containing protein [Ascosphaera apis ARSEF 7405]